jgi:hypothetical protein
VRPFFFFFYFGLFAPSISGAREAAANHRATRRFAMHLLSSFIGKELHTRE